MPDVVVASADSLLGRVQRGRGQGYVDALAVAPGEGAAALINCLTSDPRTDHQVESRDEYYGRIAVDIELDLAPLEVFLLAPPPATASKDDWRDALALYTLGSMGRLGRADAVALLRRYVEIGEDWSTALVALSWPTVLNVEGLDHVVAERAASVDELARGLPFEPDREPWLSWRRTNERIAEAAARSHLWRTQGERRRAQFAEKSVMEVLREREVSALRGRSDEVDKAALLEAATGDDEQLRHDAIKVLGWQRDQRVLDAAESELRRFPDREWPPNAGWFAIFQLLRDGPLPRVRGWLGEPGRLGEVAMHAVAEWPEPGDEALLRTMAEHFRDEEWLYRACDAVDALVRLRDRLSTALFETIFKETTYSYLRHRVARGLALLSPTFEAGLAIECLWDCEDQTIAVGCAAVSLASDVAREQLSRIAADKLADRRTRALAARRVRPLEKHRSRRPRTGS
ncbi:MAG: hypothetical protein E6J27_04680 [Chloroflexi bacterium]|nr:MAG: hypothetical protein E6J27_04680 [Chloroflexota bacterium]